MKSKQYIYFDIVRYFDLAHGGYFENKDLEDILLFSVVNLSRAQVKRLVAKVNSEKDKVGFIPGYLE